MTIGELRSILSGFPSEGNVGMHIKHSDGNNSCFSENIQEVQYDVETKSVFFESWES